MDKQGSLNYSMIQGGGGSPSNDYRDVLMQMKNGAAVSNKLTNLLGDYKKRAAIGMATGGVMPKKSLMGSAMGSNAP